MEFNEFELLAIPFLVTGFVIQVLMETGPLFPLGILFFSQKAFNHALMYEMYARKHCIFVDQHEEIHIINFAVSLHFSRKIKHGVNI
jgi:hypothetical protein